MKKLLALSVLLLAGQAEASVLDVTINFDEWNGFGSYVTPPQDNNHDVVNEVIFYKPSGQFAGPTDYGNSSNPHMLQFLSSGKNAMQLNVTADIDCGSQVKFIGTYIGGVNGVSTLVGAEDCSGHQFSLRKDGVGYFTAPEEWGFLDYVSFQQINVGDSLGSSIDDFRYSITSNETQSIPIPGTLPLMLVPLLYVSRLLKK